MCLSGQAWEQGPAPLAEPQFPHHNLPLSRWEAQGRRWFGSHPSPCLSCGPNHGPAHPGALDRSPATLGDNEPATNPGQMTGEAESLCPLRGWGGQKSQGPHLPSHDVFRKALFPSPVLLRRLSTWPGHLEHTVPWALQPPEGLLSHLSISASPCTPTLTSPCMLVLPLCTPTSLGSSRPLFPTFPL